MYFARIVFLLDDNYCFMNLSEKPVPLFTDGDAECTAHIDTRTNHCKVILEYGGFSSQQEAEEKGINLVRQIKIEMVKREFTINIAGCSGQLDSSTIHVHHGGISAWKQLCDECEEKHGSPMQRDRIIENEYIGLSVYEVAQSIREIRFISSSVEMQSKQKFSLSHDVLPYWNESMDTSLSLLSSSVGINDQRAQFLLRLMAIEVLVPPSLLREDDYLAVIDQLKNMQSKWISSRNTKIGSPTSSVSFVSRALRKRSAACWTATCLTGYIWNSLPSSFSSNAIACAAAWFITVHLRQ